MTGKPGWVRSRAWHWLFSSQHSASARSGGFRYNPTTSQNFRSKCLSLDNLNVRVAWGLMSLALHNRCTVALDTPVAAAMPRTDQRVRFGGGRVAPRTIRSRTFGSMLGLRPPPLGVGQAIQADARKRRSHLITAARLMPSLRAVSAWLRPSARCSTINARR